MQPLVGVYLWTAAEWEETIVIGDNHGTISRASHHASWMARRVSEDTSGATVEALLARIDAEHPLPRPPVRAGQIWAWPDGYHIQISAAGTGKMFLVGFELMRDMTDAFLLHDPLFPADAPWAPPLAAE